MNLEDALKRLGIEAGAAVSGVADLTDPEPITIVPAGGEEIAGSYPRAVSIAARLSRAVLEGIVDHPTKLYFQHYRTINMMLDQTALRLTTLIQAAGFDALPIPASQIVDWESQKGHVSHREVARRAGLGWIGRNNLLVTPEYGSQVRLATILTDAPLEPGTPLERDCGDCRACVDVCPASAIRENPADFDHMACFEMLKDFQRKRYAGQYICGVCVKACPGQGRS